MDYLSCTDTHQTHMNGKFHSNPDRHNQNDGRNGTQLDANQSHEAKQLHHHHSQHKHLSWKTIVQYRQMFKHLYLITLHPTGYVFK